MRTKKQKIPRISTRGYYDLSNGKKIKNSSYYLYPKKSFQKLNENKELVIVIHGLRNDSASALQKFVIAKRRLRKIGYRYPVIGYSYDANTKGAHLKKYERRALRVGQKIANQNGNNLSKFIVDFKKKNSTTKLRLIGHSLGTEVILSTVKKLALNPKNQNIIESVYFFGSSLDHNVVNPSTFGKLFQKIVKNKIVNYYSPKDEVLKQSYLEGLVKNPMGYLGVTGKKISKFKQKLVFPKNHRFVSYTAVLKSFP